MYLMKVYPEMNVPDEDISRNECTWWRYIQKLMYLMKVYPEMNVPDEGISRHALYVLNLMNCWPFQSTWIHSGI
jgi:hypothetical protein